MKFGFMHVPRSVEQTRAVAAAGERYGFDWITVPDSPVLYQDSYLHQLEIARAAPGVLTGPLVGHVVLRHPVVVANLLSTLQEFTGGRVVGTLSTSSSASRGVGLRPSTLAQLGQAVRTIRAHWRGEGGPFGDSAIPATGVVRASCPILVAGDGPKVAELAGAVGDGLVYGGTLDPAVRRRRLAAARIGAGGRQAWVAPSLSFGTTHEEVRADLGVHLVAMANRAMRGDLTERGVPAELHGDVARMRRAYDFSRADNTRPSGNASVVSERLVRHAADTLCVWGDEERFRTTIDALADEGWTGVMFVLGQVDQEGTVHELGQRLRALGHLRPATGAA